MPKRVLSEDEYGTIKNALLHSAPDGLSEVEFHRWFTPRFEGALAEAEHSRAPVTGRVIGRMVRDAALGARSGAATLVFQGGDVIRRNLGMARPVERPDVQALMTPPNTPAGRAGRFVADVVPYLSPTGTTRGLLRRTVTEAGKFGLIGGAQSGGDPVETAWSASLGAIVPVAGAAFSGARRIATEKLPERLYGQVFRSDVGDLATRYRALAKGEPENPMLAREVMERGLSGGSESMAVQSLTKLDNLEHQLQTAARGSMVSLSPNKPKYISLLMKVKKAFDNTFFSQRAAEADDLIRALNNTRAGNLSAPDALRLKRFFDRMRNTSSFKVDPQLSVAQEELKVAADTVRGALHQNKAFSTLLDEEHVYIQAFDDIVDDAVRRNNRRLLGLTDYILGGGGMAAGAGLGGVGTAAVVRGFQRPATLTGLGQSLYRTGQAIPRGGAVPAARAGGGTLARPTARQREEAGRSQ